jgi:hypothetical protein
MVKTRQYSLHLERCQKQKERKRLRVVLGPCRKTVWRNAGIPHSLTKLRAWKHLDLPLRRTIDEPIEGTTIVELLVRKQSNWFDTYEQRWDTRQYTTDISKPQQTTL